MLTDFRGYLAERPTAWVTAGKEGYVQQCPSATTIESDAIVDVRLTSVANLSIARPASNQNLRSLSGVVFETTPAGRRPVQGAGVAWETSFDGFVAWTITDGAGFYFLCDLPRQALTGVFAWKDGYTNGSVLVAAGGDVVADIEMRPR